MDKTGKKPIEVWKDIPGWERYYQASTLGNIRSKDKYVITHKEINQGHTRKGRVLKPIVKKLRYSAVTLADGKNRKQYLVHTLILLTFRGGRPLRLVTRHLNGNMYDNRLCNLEYGTQKENINDRRRHGTAGSKIPDLVTAQLIKDIAKTHVFKYKYIAEVFGVSISHIQDIVASSSWKGTV